MEKQNENVRNNLKTEKKEKWKKQTKLNNLWKEWCVVCHVWDIDRERQMEIQRRLEFWRERDQSSCPAHAQSPAQCPHCPACMPTKMPKVLPTVCPLSALSACQMWAIGMSVCLPRACLFACEMSSRRDGEERFSRFERRWRSKARHGACHTEERSLQPSSSSHERKAPVPVSLPSKPCLPSEHTSKAKAQVCPWGMLAKAEKQKCLFKKE